MPAPELRNIRRLAIALLMQDDGISEAAYNLLHPLLSGDDDILDHVEATDGRFYLSGSWEDEHSSGPVLIGYLEEMALAVFGHGAALERDSLSQLVIYTGLMSGEAGHVVEFEEINEV